VLRRDATVEMRCGGRTKELFGRLTALSLLVTQRLQHTRVVTLRVTFITNTQRNVQTYLQLGVGLMVGYV